MNTVNQIKSSENANRTFYRKANGEYITYPKAVIEFIDSCDNNVEEVYLFLDDLRDIDYNTVNRFKCCVFCTSVNQAKSFITKYIDKGVTTIYFDLDHDLGDFAKDGGDAIKLIDWLVENYHDKNMNFKFHFHSMNPVGVGNMKNAVSKYWPVV